jgi:GMP synthase-like glutamine amidotransferase
MARCLVLQHLEPEGPYRVADALKNRGVEVETRRVFAGDTVPEDPSEYDALVVMGGTMSAASDDGFPTRRSEIGYLQAALSSGLPTLGICLGAQLLAVAAGAAVYAGDAGAEVGWLPVQLTEIAASDRLFAGISSPLKVLQWHGDTFDLPPGSTHLALSDVYPNQAFRVGESAWGLQFHLEVDANAVAAFMEGFDSDSCTRGFSRQLIEDSTATALLELAPIRSLVLDRFADVACDYASLRTGSVSR